MKVLIVDDEPLVLKDTARIIGKAIADFYKSTDYQLITCDNSSEAISIVGEEHPDVIFLDIDMPNMSGLDVAERTIGLSPDSNIIFVTGYPNYSIDAWNTRASGFLLKPINETDILKAFERLRRPLIINKKLEIRCYGGFHVSFGGQRIHFARKKSIEMLAVLVDAAGSEVSVEKIRAYLWNEDDDNEGKKSYVRVLASDINATLREVGVDNALINTFGGYAINRNKVVCDHFDYLDKKIDRPKGEYMPQFDWVWD